MKYSQTIAGMLVVALIGLAVYWVRSGQPGASDALTAAESALPEISRHEGRAASGAITIVAAVDPAPPVAYSIFRLRVSAETAQGMVPIDDARVSFDMAMPMGEYRYRLMASAGGAVTADVTLPTCPTGSPHWFANITGTVGGQRVTARFRFELAPPK